MSCTVCGNPKIHAVERCLSCYQYRRRHHGRDKTWDDVTQSVARAIERELEGRFVI